MSEAYYVIAEVDQRALKSGNDSKWPKVLAYSNSAKKLFLSEGCGHGLMGGKISLIKFNASDWHDFFKDTNSTWFQKLIADGTLFSINEESDFLDLLAKNNCSVKIVCY
ncbi:hypothetical protein ACJJID_12710 [Microbulbifer sp. CnH-101-G]|uniref:hypothetical protein n=1 Tax=Microbulbifer sp. CnH-101-G TaxID=3243393 RepID=UPI0040394AA7